MAKVSFCGISGSGMSALAQILKARGDVVCGSDRSFDQGKDMANRHKLENIGVRIYPQDGSAISVDTNCLYVSTAIEDSIPDVKKALKYGVAIKKRSDLLAEIFNSFKFGIAIGGTSGKTTLTAMVGFILDQLRHKPTVINGGLLKNYLDQPGIPNVIINDGDICVIEADESDGSIEKYQPYLAVVNNITIDHKPIEELQTLFGTFVKKARGGAILNLDCVNSQVLLSMNHNVCTFSISNPQASIYVHDIRPLTDGIEYTLDNKVFHLKLPGAFNAANAAAALATCQMLGVDKFAAAKTLENFLGTKRRLDVIGTKNNITVIDDFAHNPDKVKASMTALRDYPGRLLIMFQPHGFSPMRMMGREIMENFANLMQADDCLFVPEIFYAGGTVKRDISSADLVDIAIKAGAHAEFSQTRNEIKQRMINLARPGDRIVVMGARDNTLPEFCQEILKEL